MTKRLFNERMLCAVYNSLGLNGVIDRIHTSDIIMTEDNFSDYVIDLVNQNKKELLIELFKEKNEYKKKTRRFSTD